MKIGIIGSGEMGSCLASKLAEMGHAVSIANSQGPASLQQLAKKIGAVAASVEDVTKNNKVIIIAIPQKNVQCLPKTLFQQLPCDVVVVETGNYYPGLRDGIIPELVQTGIDSLWVQQQLGVPVVKVFNAILATSLRDLGKPKGDKDRIALAVSGDDTKAKEVVSQLVDDLGFDPLDIGPIAQSWKQQPGSSIYCRDLNLAELKRRVDAMGTNWSEMHDPIIEQRKTNEALMKADYLAYLKALQIS
jgi:predicted dinucleotide-binding enzyme